MLLLIVLEDCSTSKMTLRSQHQMPTVNIGKDFRLLKYIISHYVDPFKTAVFPFVLFATWCLLLSSDKRDLAGICFALVVKWQISYGFPFSCLFLLSPCLASPPPIFRVGKSSVASWGVVCFSVDLFCFIFFYQIFKSHKHKALSPPAMLHPKSTLLLFSR